MVVLSSLLNILGCFEKSFVNILNRYNEYTIKLIIVVLLSKTDGFHQRTFSKKFTGCNRFCRKSVNYNEIMFIIIMITIMEGSYKTHICSALIFAMLCPISLNF